MSFYFCGRYIYTDCDGKEVDGLCLMIVMDMKLEKVMLKISLVIVLFFLNDCYGYEAWI